jgi:predicted O-methyltransferase YrrM
VFQGRLDSEWNSVQSELETLGFTDQMGGVNAGDRRALYYLVRTLAPSRVLEIGTHIGASTAHIALALRNGLNPNGQLTTVDIRDVNDGAKRPWEAFGSHHSPATVIEMLGYLDRVEFVVADSVVFLQNHSAQFDLIFLDGDHSAPTVYTEVPHALRALNREGLVLLHDFFPNGAPLWSDGDSIPGPALAIERLRSEGAELRVTPFGQLPWPTKLGSRVTSLALLSRS